MEAKNRHAPLSAEPETDVECVQIDYEVQDGFEQKFQKSGKSIDNLTSAEWKSNPAGISRFFAFFLLFRSLMGIGILAYAHTVQHAGYMNVLVSIVPLLAVLIYGVFLIIHVADDMGYVKDSLELLVERVLGKHHKIFTIITNWFNCFACCVANIIMSIGFIEHSSRQLGFEFANMRQWYNLVAFCIVIPSCFIHNFKAFKFIATGALVVMLVAVISILYFDLSTILERGISPSARQWDIYKWPEFFGVTCFAVEGVPCIIPIRATLKRRDKFKGLFMLVMISAAVLLVAMGIFGCLCFGKNIQSIIFLNFGSDQLYFFILQMLYGLCCIVTFPMYVNVSCNIIFNISKFRGCFIDSPNYYWNCTLFRFITIVGLFGISISGIKITSVLHFAGALSNCYLAIVMPCLLFMVWYTAKNRCSPCMKIFLWHFIVIGTALTALSIFTSVWDIIQQATAEAPNKRALQVLNGFHGFRNLRMTSLG